MICRCSNKKCVLVFRFEVNETIGSLTLVAYRNKGTHGNVSLSFFAQNLEAQKELDYNTSETVSTASATWRNVWVLTRTKFIEIVISLIAFHLKAILSSEQDEQVFKLRCPVSTKVIHFADGERYKFVEVQITDDAFPEGAERFQLILSKPSPGLQLGTNTTGM